MVTTKDVLLNDFQPFYMIEATISIRDYICLHMNKEQFKAFCIDNGLKTVFYHYGFYDKDQYLITPDLLREYTHNTIEYNYCKKWADQYNLQVEKKNNFSRPHSLLLMTSFNSLPICIMENDEWLSDDLENGSSVLLDYLDTHEDELLDLLDGGHEDEDTLYKELESILLDDKKFRFCSNKSSRENYLNVFLENDTNKKFLKLVKRCRYEDEQFDQLLDIVNQIYNEYRNACRASKTSIGEPLKNKND